MMRCEVCNTPFWDKGQLERHVENHNSAKKFPCQYCKKSFFRSHRRKMHENTCLNNPDRVQNRLSQSGAGNHKDSNANANVNQVQFEDEGRLKFYQHAFNGTIKEYRYVFDNQLLWLDALDDILKTDVSALIQKNLDQLLTGRSLFKWYLGLQVSLSLIHI